MKTNQVPLNILFSSEEFELFITLRKRHLFLPAYLNDNHRILKLEVTLEVMYLVCSLHFRVITEAGEANSPAKGHPPS